MRGWARMNASKSGAKRCTMACVAAAARTRPAGECSPPATRSRSASASSSRRIGVLERGLAGRRELDAALGSDEERLAELGLERLDLVADRRLRQAEPLGGAGEVERLGDDPEGAKLREFHPPPLASIITKAHE